MSLRCHLFQGVVLALAISPAVHSAVADEAASEPQVTGQQTQSSATTTKSAPDEKPVVKADPVSEFGLMGPLPAANHADFRYLYVDEPNGKFGEYNGLDEDSHHGVFNLEAVLRHAGAPNRYWDFNVRNLGLATYQAQAAYGHQGKFRIRGGQQQLQKVWQADALSPWSDDLERLDEPRELTTRSKRKVWNLGFDAWLGPDWALTTNYRDEDRTGQRPKAGNFGQTVPQRLDMNHQEFDASLVWSSRQATVAITGYLSEFTNVEDLILNTTAPPDNDYQKFAVKGSWRGEAFGQFNAYLASARGRQNDPFSRYGITPGTYETDSLQGKYDLTQLRLTWRKRFTRNLDLDASYWREERDNDTPLWADFPGDRNNRVYDWDKELLQIRGRYRLPGRWRLIGAVERKDRDSTVSKVPRDFGRLPEQAGRINDQSEEITVWAELRSPVIGGFFGSLKLARGDREVDLDPVRLEAATQDPRGLSLPSYLLPRVQDRVDLTLTWSANDFLTFGLLLKHQSDDYDPIAWASLEDVELSNVTLDVGVNMTEHWVLGAYLGMDEYQVKQQGYASQGDDDTIWNYDIRDQGYFAGLNLHGRELAGRVDLRVDYRFYDGEGRYETIDPNEVSGAFPDLLTTIHTLSIRADIRLSPSWRLDVGYLFEDYDSDRWVWRNDFGEAGDTWYEVLNYGYDSPVYRTQVVMVSGRYQF